MMLRKISKNKLKFVRQLQNKKFRQEHNLYLISGLRAVQEALKSSELQVKSILIDESHLHLMNELPTISCQEWYSLNEKEFRQVVEEKTPQGVALVVQKPTLKPPLKSFSSRLLFLEKVNDPGNLGTLMRSASWFGWPTVLLSPNSTDPFAPKTVRASAGTIAHLKIYEQVTHEDLLELKKKHGFQLMASTVQKGSALNKLRSMPHSRIILALGSEAHGLSQEVLQISDHQFTILKPGKGESLNLAMAGTIFLYHFSMLNLADRKGATKNE